MNQRKGVMNLPVVMLSVLGIITFGFGASFVYLSLNGADYSELYSQRILTGEIKNPVTEFQLSAEDIESIFSSGNQSSEIPIETEINLIKYAAISLKLYNLHNIPFTSITPLIKIRIAERIYLVEVDDGELFVSKRNGDGEDLIVNTNSEEIKKIFEDESYASESFNSGKSSVEIIASKLELLTKGYLAIYNEWVGNEEVPEGIL